MTLKSMMSGAAAAAFVLGSLGHAAAAAKGGKKDVLRPAEAMQWADGPAKGVKVAPLWGDMTKGGPYGVLIKFDAGTIHPLHRHSQTLKIVVISGTFLHRSEDGAETRLGPGSYMLQAAGVKHVSGCSPEAGCEFLMTSGEKFDMTVVETAPGEKK